MSRKMSVAGMLLLTTVVALGCGGSTGSEAETVGEATSASAQYVLAEKPANALGVAEAREATEAGSPIAVTGRIGGSGEPFVEGIAAFTIVDPALQPCPAEEGCPTPWDYCCDTNLLKTNVATVTVVDDQGSAVMQDARQLLGVKELSTVVVVGKASRDESGNLTVLADKVHVVQQ